MPLVFQPPGDVPPTRTTHLGDKTLADVASHVSRDYVGAATFATSFTYFPDASRKITRVDLTFALSIEMPVWDNYAARPQKERQEWDRFCRALLEHEKGHIQIYKREAQTMFAAMMRARPDTIERVEGEDLSALIDGALGLQTPGTLPGLHLSDALRIARQIAEALEARTTGRSDSGSLRRAAFVSS